MRLKKRFFLIGLMALTLLIGAMVAWPVLGQTEGGTPTPTPPPPPQTLLARVATILGIPEQQLTNAFAQAQRQMQDEALDRFLQKAVEKGKMTQEEANQYKAWWQSRPQTSSPGPFKGLLGRHGIPPAVDSSSPTLLARVATILGIPEQQLTDAFAQAQRQMQDEALDRFLQKAVEKGKMTQEEANQYKAWWQSRPQTSPPGPFKGLLGRHGMFKHRGPFMGPQPQPTPGTSF